MQKNPANIAIIGAGLAGLTCGAELVKQGYKTTLFDKGNRPGGRSCSRLFEQWSVDHGAQYFTAKSALFKDRVKAWQDEGLVKPWGGEIVALNQSISPVENKGTRFVSTPMMGSLAMSLAKDLDLHLESMNCCQFRSTT